MSSRVTRQQFLRRSAGAAAGLTVLGSPLLRPSSALAAPLVRRDVGPLGASDPILVSYRNAIAAMKALPATDPRSWTYQAAIHGTYSGPNKTAWNTCQHHNKFFWPWHRMYLYYFERIVREMSGDPTWTLPYWNYGSASQRHLPAPFRDATSALYVANRGAGWNSGSASLPSWIVDTSAGMALTDYTDASSSLEGTPHDNVHVQIGGWMGDPYTAGQDPIFFLHHCNMDRLWNAWLAQGGGRVNLLSDSAWKTQPWTFFDEHGKQVTLTGCDVLRAALQLDYGYEGEPAQVNEFCIRFVIPYRYLRVRFELPIPPELLAKRLETIRIPFAQLRDRLVTAARDENQTVFLTLDKIAAARQPGVVWQVYLGEPGAPRKPESPSFIGNLSLFAMGVRHKGKEFMPATLELPIDRAILAAAQSNSDTLVLTFVATGPLIDGRPSAPKLASQVRIGRMSVSVETRRKA